MRGDSSIVENAVYSDERSNAEPSWQNMPMPRISTMFRCVMEMPYLSCEVHRNTRDDLVYVIELIKRNFVIFIAAVILFAKESDEKPVQPVRTK